MRNDFSLWQFIFRRLKKSQKVMLLLVAESSGSSPGRQGFKMAVSENGKMHGSIGGGIMEVKLVELAKARLQKKVKSILIKKQIHSTSALRHRSGMICSGEQTIVYCALSKKHIATVRHIIRTLEKFKSAVLHISGEEDSLQLRVMKKTQNEIPYQFLQQSGAFRYEENLGIQDRLYIIGGGHCALALSALMARMNFYITLLDDRKDLSTFLQNRYVHEKHVLDSYEGVGSHITEGNNTYVVIMTLGYRSDEMVLRLIINQHVCYMGLLGSANKIKTMMGKLARDKIPLGLLKKVHAPIGVNINSRTPEEIAVSIAAEIIGVKNRLDG